jgi:general secretion pathway protein D
MNMRHVINLLLILLVSGVAAGCSTVFDKSLSRSAIADLPQSKPTPPISPDSNFRVSGPATDYTGSVNALTKAEFYAGGGDSPKSGAAPTGVASVNKDGDYTLNFVDAPISEAVDVIIGDILKENYAIDKSVTGSVTLRTSAPVPRDDVLPILENLLALKGASLVKTKDVWHVVPFDAARRLPNVVVSPDRSTNAQGLATHIIPLEYVPVKSVIDVISDQITPGRQLVGDPDRNLLIFVGPSQEAQAIEDMVAVLDVDVMRDKVFALIPIEAAPVTDIIGNLESVFQGSAQDTIRFVPIARLNAVLAIARKTSTLDEARKWVARFDRTNVRADNQAFVYYVKNGRATELAKILDQLFSDGDGGSGMAPGLSPVAVNAAADKAAGDKQPADASPDKTETTGSIAPSSGGNSNGPRIIADERNNALVIRGSPEDYHKIEAILARLDIVPLQVMIEVTVAEVSLSGQLEHGIEWYLNSGDFSASFSGAKGGSIGAGLGLSFQAVNAKVVLDALESVTNVNVISSPKLMVLDNQSARLQVGDQVPVATRSVVSTDNPNAPVVNTVEMVDTGVILEVTPTVNADGLVSLRVVQEVSDATTTQTSKIDSPTIQTRKFESTLAVQSGETAALAGLMRDRHESGESGMPGLRRVPLLGNLFKRSVNKNGRTELLVLITPRVVRDPGEMRAVTNDLREKLQSFSNF